MRILHPAIIPVLAMSIHLLAADLSITFNTKGKGLFKSAEGVQVEHYTGTHQLTRDESTKQDTLVDFVKGITYSIDHKKKTIGMLKFEDALALMEKMNNPQGGMGTVLGAMFGDPNDVSVEKEGTQVVAGHLCNRYKIKVARLNAELFADPKLKLPVADAAWARSMKARAGMMASAGSAAAAYKRLYEEMAKINGVVLKSTMGGGMTPTVERTATAVSRSPIDKALFRLPEGYKMEDLGKQMREEMAKGAK